MKAAAEKLMGTHDFKAFSDNKRMKKSTVRTISDIDIYSSETEITITVAGDDFWPNMVRNMVGLLIEIGEGKRKPEDIIEIFKHENRRVAGKTAPSCGLYLRNVFY